MSISSPLLDRLRSQLRNLPLPGISGLNAADALVDASLEGEKLNLELDLGFPCNRFTDQLSRQIHEHLSSQWSQVAAKVRWHTAKVATINNQNTIARVKNSIAVASSKGGVGKSTTAVNIALALVAEGARVGILDADIYGPSQALMLGVADRRPEMHSPNKMKPIVAHGLQMISMGNLVTENTPVVWRGPMVSGALQQLLNQTQWDDVDYLIVDMPPGTG